MEQLNLILQMVLELQQHLVHKNIVEKIMFFSIAIYLFF